MGNSWPTAVAVAAIAISLAVYYTAQAWFAHRERMAQIEKGHNPDKLSDAS